MYMLKQLFPIQPWGPANCVHILLDHPEVISYRIIRIQKQYVLLEPAKFAIEYRTRSESKHVGGFPCVQTWMIEITHDSVRRMIENTAMGLKLKH